MGIWMDVPTTDEEAIECLGNFTERKKVNCTLVGLYKTHRGKGKDTLDAFQATIEFHLSTITGEYEEAI